MNMLMMGHSLDTYYRTNAAEYGVMLLANHLANGMSDQGSDVKQEQQEEYASMSDYLAARRQAKQEGRW